MKSKSMPVFFLGGWRCGNPNEWERRDIHSYAAMRAFRGGLCLSMIVLVLVGHFLFFLSSSLSLLQYSST